MGKLLPQYQTSVIEDIVYSITSNVSHYYAFAANPIAYDGNPPTITTDAYTTTFTNDWQMLFGKKLSNGDIVPVILNNTWTENTVYNRFDNTVPDLTNYFVVAPPGEAGGDYRVYTCIDRPSNGAGSIYKPDQVQQTSFKQDDGYTWRYITSITRGQYNKTATVDYCPVTSNATIVAAAPNYAGIEVVVVRNGGSGYECYANGYVRSVPNTDIIQIEPESHPDQDYYTDSSIYFINIDSNTNALRTIVDYYVNTSSGAKFVKLNEPIDANTIISGVTQYDIAPSVVFKTDGIVKPKARCFIDPQTNSIANVQILVPGSDTSWCNVSIQSNTSYGSGANVYGIVPPPGGHGYDPAAHLDIKGFAVSFFFSNTESDTIPANTLFNKIGLIKNPYTLEDDGTKTTIPYTSNTFNAVLQGNVTTQFTLGDSVIGLSSKARGTVAFSNSTTLYLTGDKYFTNNETIVSAVSETTNSQLVINTLGDIYTKDISPLYVQNITNVTRAANTTESFKLIIKV